jgi:hypothetical protein
MKTSRSSSTLIEPPVAAIVTPAEETSDPSIKTLVAKYTSNESIDPLPGQVSLCKNFWNRLDPEKKIEASYQLLNRINGIINYFLILDP